MYQFHCNLQDGIAREVCFTGMYEPQETLILRNLLRPGQTFLDVGANWGYFTLLAAHCVGPAGYVISLEPDPRLYPQLRFNIDLNGLAHVQTLQVAAAANEGVMTLAGFDESGENFGISRLVPDTEEAGGRTFAVRTASLDELLDELKVGIVDLLKMDIEGAEALAIPGLRRSLASHRVRQLLVEVHPQDLKRHGMRTEQLLKILTDAGYRSLRVAHDPVTTRRAAYSRVFRWTDLLTPFDAAGGLDGWPHLLFLAPSVNVPQ